MYVSCLLTTNQLIDLIFSVYKSYVFVKYVHNKCEYVEAPWSFYKKKDKQYTLDNRIVDLTMELSNILTQGYIYVFNSLHNKINIGGDYNEIIIKENLDISQCLINIRDVLNKNKFIVTLQNYIILHNSIEKLPDFSTKNLSRDNEEDLLFYKEYIKEEQNYNIYMGLFTNFHENKDDILCSIDAL